MSKLPTKEDLQEFITSIDHIGCIRLKLSGPADRKHFVTRVLQSQGYGVRDVSRDDSERFTLEAYSVV